jgi:hypothetical protein
LNPELLFPDLAFKQVPDPVSDPVLIFKVYF